MPALPDLVRLMMLQASGTRPQVDTGGRNRYVTDEDTEDQSLDPAERYPLHRLSRDPTPRSIAADHVNRELQRVRRLFPHAGQISGRGRADAIDAAVTGAQRGERAAPAGGDRASLEAELEKLRKSPNFISDSVQTRIAAIKKKLAAMK